MSSIKKAIVARQILGERFGVAPKAPRATAFAPANIALCKYWGKRDEDLNLPVTASLSVSLGTLGTETTVSLASGPKDEISLNGHPVADDAPFARALTAYLALFRPTPALHLRVETKNTVPTAAGMASSASGYAALILALNSFFGWELTLPQLSILARIGSGSACRSVYTGFVEWSVGAAADGMDSYAIPFPGTWPALRLGVIKLSEKQKEISSRDAMKRTRLTSPLYGSWPDKVARDMAIIKESIAARAFESLGRAAESNALAMHATGLGAWPPVLFWLPESLATMRNIWALREDGLPLYFTMDAGPNVKLLFTAEHEAAVRTAFPSVELVAPFSVNHDQRQP